MSSSLAMAPLSEVLVPTKPTKEELTSPNVSQFQIPEDGRNYEIYLPVKKTHTNCFLQKTLCSIFSEQNVSCCMVGFDGGKIDTGQLIWQSLMIQPTLMELNKKC